MNPQRLAIVLLTSLFAVGPFAIAAAPPADTSPSPTPGAQSGIQLPELKVGCQVEILEDGNIVEIKCS